MGFAALNRSHVVPSVKETRIVYRFDASRLDLAREYQARPFGEHSPDLQYLLNLMRTRETDARHVLVMTRPHAQWTLARLTDGNQGPPRLTNMTFDSLEAAEWAVFKLRWEEMAGVPLPIE
ncbi:MAG TPA: hypothetical protein VGI78_15100 [Acetobacteraceae bacterium]